MHKSCQWVGSFAAIVCVSLLTAVQALAHEGHTASPPVGASDTPLGVNVNSDTPSLAKRRPPPLAIGATFAPSGELWIVGLDDAKRLFVQTSADDGKHWSATRIIGTGDDKIAADGENRPKIVFGSNGRAVITYTEPLTKPFSGRIRMLRSTDTGQTFSAPFTVHRDTQEITHRFESVAFDRNGVLHAIWIDKRDLEAVKAAGKKSSYIGAAIYRNESHDGGQTFGPDIKLADHSCECCRIALAPSPDGGMVAMWRHVFAPNERDHAFAPLRTDANHLPTRATFDHWAIDACPHHGPGLSAAEDGGYHAVWFGIRDSLGRVRYGQLNADGSPRGEALALPDERAEHASVESAGKNVVIAWRSFDGKATNWRAWISDNGGQQFTQRELGQTADDNDHPLLLKRDGKIFALWRTGLQPTSPTKQGVRVEQVTP
ncbi:MAG: exo-alpha-sialidase [Rhodocyclaceae bacterium]|nr:hypothetical protein [Rhodocyclaceae bacterium]MBP6109433.1 exo-alpha-sialidase [Rhodocyclaceae bacterium]MBP6279116.1 exo-alpha-sialidase [Rhodocyclaceae bacterium]